MEVSDQLRAPAAAYPGKELPAVQPVARRDTDWAIPAVYVLNKFE